jgi:formylglycine-generating enzyme required for sulfatase activity
MPILLEPGDRARVSLSIPRSVPDGFVFVPEGDSLMGSDEELLRTPLAMPPMHRVHVPGFYIGRYEITFDEYLEWLDALPEPERADRMPGAVSDAGTIAVRLEAGRWTLSFKPEGNGKPLGVTPAGMVRYPARTVNAEQRWRRFPVSGVSFNDAEAFAAWRAGLARPTQARLCREEEWERAARGADGRIYPNGHVLDPGEANIDLTYGGVELAFGPDEVGLHPASASPFGVEDLAGNAAEMVYGRRWKEHAATRGSDWYHERVQQRFDTRFRLAPGTRDVGYGFRLCADMD